MLIRNVHMEDAAALLDIYRPYIATNITFEIDEPSVEEFAGRIAEVTEKYPYIAAEENGKIVGYAYAHAFRTRAAYRWSAELSIYLEKSACHRGIGRALISELLERLTKIGIRMAYACVVAGNESSIRLFEHLGFREIGTFTDSGRKNGQWLDTVWFEKRLNESSDKSKSL